MKKRILLIVGLVIILVGVLFLGGCTAVKGEKGDTGGSGLNGEDGVGISNVVYNTNDGTLTIYLTNGTSYTTQSLKGLKGDKGDTGVQGIQGIQGIQGATGVTGATGATGATGVGIYAVSYNGTTGKLTITLTNGVKYDTGDLRANCSADIAYLQSQIDNLVATVNDYVAQIDMLYNHQFAGIANAISDTNLGIVNGAGCFTVFGACSFTGTLTSSGWIYPYDNAWFSNSITGQFIIASLDQSYAITIDVVGSQGSSNYMVFAGTFIVTSGGIGHGTILATFVDLGQGIYQLQITVNGYFVNL
jgi:hypothetical protein